MKKVFVLEAVKKKYRSGRTGIFELIIENKGSWRRKRECIIDRR